MIQRIGLLLLLLAGCGTESARETPAKPRVVATTTLVGDLVRHIAGDAVELTVLMPAGVDPHTFKPSTADLGNIAKADLVFYNGLHLEGKMVELFEDKLKDRAIPVTRDIPKEKLLAWEDGQSGAFDPHIWFDVRLWCHAGATVHDVLAQKLPSQAPALKQRFEQYDAQLASLHDEVRAKLAGIPVDRRVLITSHDAYSYFGKAYDVEVRGLQGISTETEAGLASINAAVDFILSRKIPAIFVESSVSHKTIERVQADVRARGFDVKIGGEIYSDALGAATEHPGLAVDTYIGMVRYNVETLCKALGENP